MTKSGPMPFQPDNIGDLIKSPPSSDQYEAISAFFEAVRCGSSDKIRSTRERAIELLAGNLSAAGAMEVLINSPAWKSLPGNGYASLEDTEIMTLAGSADKAAACMSVEEFVGAALNGVERGAPVRKGVKDGLTRLLGDASQQKNTLSARSGNARKRAMGHTM